MTMFNNEQSNSLVADDRVKPPTKAAGLSDASVKGGGVLWRHRGLSSAGGEMHGRCTVMVQRNSLHFGFGADKCYGITRVFGGERQPTSDLIHSKQNRLTNAVPIHISGKAVLNGFLCTESWIMCGPGAGSKRSVLVCIAVSIACVVLVCEYAIYFPIIGRCSWPELKEDRDPVRALFLSDPHLLGAIRGHWFDKLRR